MLDQTELQNFTESISILELLRSPLWLLNLDRKKIEWANASALQQWSLNSIFELNQMCWDDSYSFTLSELAQIHLQKPVTKRLLFHLCDQHFCLDGIYTKVLEKNDDCLVLVQPNDITLEPTNGHQPSKELKKPDILPIITKLSNHFISIDSQEIDLGINQALQMIGEFEKVDRSYVFIFSDQTLNFSNTHEWCAEDVKSYMEHLQNIESGQFPWFIGKIKRNEIIYISDVSSLGKEASSEKASLQAQDIQSLISVPIIHHETVLGFVGFDAVKQAKGWTQDSINLLQIFAEMLAHTIHRQKFEIVIQEHERKLTHLINSLPGIVFTAMPDEQWSMKYLSDGCFKLTGYESEELLNLEAQTYNKITHPEDLPRVISNINSAILLKRPYEVEYRIRTKNGEEKWVWEKGSGVFDESGLLQRLEGFITDITQLKRTEDALIKAERQYRNIFEHITQGIFQINIDGQYIKANPALAAIYGYDSAEDLMNNLTDIETQLYVEPQQRKTLLKHLKKKGYIQKFETQVYRKDQSIIWTSETVRAVYDEEHRFLYYEGTVEDITVRRKTEEKLLYDAFYDQLTGLPNRTWLMLQLSSAIQRIKEKTEELYAVLFIDLDSFKVVNDSLGHLVGDDLIKQVAQRLQNVLKSEDKIARFGGDEFVVIIENLKDINEIIQIAEQIHEQFKYPFKLENENIIIGASLGITLSSFGYSTPIELLRDADIAMYKAKAKGKFCYVIFNPEMKKEALERLQIENELRQAIQDSSLQLFYQPIISLSTGQLIGFEALIRWPHSSQQRFYPNEFIPIAEETGLILPLSLWVLQEACQQLQHWRKAYPQAAHLVININLSVHQLRENTLVEQLQIILEKTELDGKSLKLEITENSFLEVIETQNSVVEQLKAMGIGLCIDDFGVGYSSLSRLDEFPIDILKIDRSFINRLENHQSAVVQTIITLAHNLGINVVAEGIETKKQLAILKDLNCELGQGYLFAKPLDKNAATEYICYSSRENDPLIELEE